MSFLLNADTLNVKLFKHPLFIVFIILCGAQVSIASERENTLSFKDVMTGKESKSYRVLKLETQELGIQVTATQGQVCFLPYQEFVADWVVEGKCRGDAPIAKTYEKEVLKVQEFFSNAERFRLTCSRRGDKVVGYSFYGHTTVEGKAVFANRSKAFDLAQYPEPEPERSPGAVEKALKDSFRALGKLLF